MALPANIRVNIGVPFPSLVKATGPISISKQNGIWTVGFSIANLGASLPNTPPGNLLLLVYNNVTGAFQQMPVSQVAGSIRAARVITATGNIAVQSTDAVLLMNPTVPAVCSIQLPAAASRSTPLSVKDLQGFAAANNISLTPNGTDKIDGVNAAFVMNDNFEAVTLNPLADGSGWWIG